MAGDNERENYVRQQNEQEKNRATVETDCAMKYDDKGPVCAHLLSCPLSK